MVDEEPAANACGRMNFYSGQKPSHLAEKTRKQAQILFPQPMIAAVKPERMQTRIAQQHHRQRRGRRIAFKDGTNVFANGPDHSHADSGFSCAIKNTRRSILRVLARLLAFEARAAH